MKKVTPDPPLPSQWATVSKTCGGGTIPSPVYSIRPGITAQEALMYASVYLSCAYETGTKAVETDPSGPRGLLWSTMHSIEMAQGLVEALLDGLAAETQEQVKT
ncbi:hypothetical protein ACYU03_24985 [Pseudomonas sp. X10]